MRSPGLVWDLLLAGGKRYGIEVALPFTDRTAVAPGSRAIVDPALVVAHRQRAPSDVDAALADGDDLVEPLVGPILRHELHDVDPGPVREV